MLAPGLATMLVVITTDADLRRRRTRCAPCAPRPASRFDRLDSDGCMSTNDQVTLLASGASGVVPALDEFTDGAHRGLPRSRAAAAGRRRGRQPRHHDRGPSAPRPKTTPSRSAARSPATTCSRPRSSATTPTGDGCSPPSARRRPPFDPYLVDVSMNGVRVCHAGRPDAPARRRRPRRRGATHVLIDLHAGEAAATIFTNDLTHDYVHENSAYAS